MINEFLDVLKKMLGLKKKGHGQQTFRVVNGDVAKIVDTKTPAPAPAPVKARRYRLPGLTSKEVRGVIGDNCSLIKTVPPDLVPGIERRVKRIYEGTSTPETLMRYLEHTCDLEPWQAERIVRDQMNKYYAMTKLERMRKRGVKRVRWVHGGAKEPREYHIRDWDGMSGKRNGCPNGLNGYIFDIDNPPVIDMKTGERGYPGQLVGCHCRLEIIE